MDPMLRSIDGSHPAIRGVAAAKEAAIPQRMAARGSYPLSRMAARGSYHLSRMAARGRHPAKDGSQR